MKDPKYIRFDWAMKKLLRNKANFVVLEGLISTLLNKDITIVHLLESESNKEDRDDKQNRVDLLAEDSNGDKFIIEVQSESEYSYFQRILFGTSKLITEYINTGQGYDKVQKVYSINIVYFDLGRGTDYIYHGKTEFRGVHTNDILSLSPFQKQKYECDEVSDLYPEYYILKVNGFNAVAKSSLEEWIQFLKNGEIPENPKAKGLKEAQKIMLYESMSKSDKAAYQALVKEEVILRANVVTAMGEGRLEGLAEGRAEGRVQGLAEGRAEGIAEGRAEGRVQGLAEGRAEGIAEGRAEGRAEEKLSIARNLISIGMDLSSVSQATGLSIEELKNFNQ